MRGPGLSGTAGRRSFMVAAIAALALTTAGCGRAVHTSGTGPTSPQTAPSAVSSTASTVRTSASSPSSATTDVGMESGTEAGTSLSAVQADAQAVDGATNQSDADFDAGQAAQAQNDNP